MHAQNEIIERILPGVERPSRYLGSEYNSCHKDPATVDLRLALVFPDLYDMGLGNLGLLILYSILNDRPWCWAERAYAPAPDMEAALRARGVPLFTSESKTPLNELDGIGFTLQSELTYTTVLNLIDLSGLPVRAEQRGDQAPLVFAGGPGAFNPEPLAPFMDFLVIGDGEDAAVEVAEALRATKGQPKQQRLEVLGEIEGVYVPALWPVETLPSGRVVPVAGRPPVRRRLLRQLDGARFPGDALVPFTHLIHDRAGIEVMRGCTHGCRFCHAGMVSRPVRERGLDEINRLMHEVTATGYEEFSLVSLSTCDYSQAARLVQAAAAHARATRSTASLPSLRLDTFSVNLANMTAGARRSGLTFAPEAASPRLRAVINKWIPDEELIHTAEEAFRRGWGHVKCYFMIGLPTERDEDVEAIADLCRRTLEAGRRFSRRAQLNTGVSTFVPKPFTPFQWAEQISMDETRRRLALLERAFGRARGIKFGHHNPRSTFIEGLLARGDRRAADLIEAAWRNGARLDSSDEYIRMDAWQTAIEQTGYAVEQALGAREPSERLPWDHIDAGVNRTWLEQEWRAALALETAPDCRHGACRRCGLTDAEPGVCAEMHARYTPELDAPVPAAPLANEREAPPTVQRLQFRIGRDGEARFLSHLELNNAWIRALRRAELPLSYSQGFHAHPKIAFATAPPVGETSEADYMDVFLTERCSSEDALERLRTVLPRGFHVYDCVEPPLAAPALMAALRGFTYRLEGPGDADAVRGRAEALIRAEQVMVVRGAETSPGGRSSSKPRRDVDVRPLVAELAVHATPDGVRVDAELRVIEGRGIRIRELLQLLGLDPILTRVHKLASRF